MAKEWEYLVVSLSEFSFISDEGRVAEEEVVKKERQILNSYGEKGWELVAVTEYGTYQDNCGHKAYFKKEKT